MERAPEGGNIKSLKIKFLNPTQVKKVGYERKVNPQIFPGCATNLFPGKHFGGHKKVPDSPVAATVEQWRENCPFCGKLFLSLISLFNHLSRRHDVQKEEVVGSSSGNGVMIAKWNGTGKRSERKPLIREEIKQAAVTLMEIYNLEMENLKLKKFNFENPFLNYSWILESTDVIIPKGKPVPVDVSENRNFPIMRYSSWSDQGFSGFLWKSPISGTGSKDWSFKGKASQGISPMKKMKKTIGDNNPSSSSTSSSSSSRALFRCNICYKNFTSYQALGGHRSCHNKLKNVVDINDNVGRGKVAVGGGHEKRSHWGDANDECSYFDWRQMKKMKNVHEVGVKSVDLGEHYYYDQQKEDEEMEVDQQDDADADDEEEVEDEDEEEDGDGDGDGDWNDVYSDGTTSTPAYGTSSSS